MPPAPSSLPPVSFPASANDSYRFRGQRAALIRQLRARGIADTRVLDAINAVPRHLFFESGFEEQAYVDKAFPIGQGQTISQPYTVAYQTELLATLPGQRVLEIGTGSGYQCCVLLALGVDVYTVELIPALCEQAQRRFNELRVTPHALCADGSEGWPSAAPFDRILVTAGAAQVPPALLRQLAIGGMMVIPVGPEGDIQRMMRVMRESATAYRREEYDDFRFVPLRTRAAVIPGEPNT